MEKPTKRKAFNFLRSYFDVLNELDKEDDKLKFLLSIINKQFLDEDPKELNFIVNLCYSSQKHAVESSIKGWKRVNKTDVIGNPITDPTTDPTTNPMTDPKEEEVEEKEKVEEVTTIEKENLIEDIFKKVSINYNTYAKQLFADAGFVEALSMNQIKDQNKDVCKNTIHKYLKLFLSHLNEYKHIHNNKKEFSANFSNWLRKQTIVKVYPKQDEIRYF